MYDDGDDGKDLHLNYDSVLLFANEYSSEYMAEIWNILSFPSCPHLNEFHDCNNDNNNILPIPPILTSPSVPT